jgi:hypothetical protein
MKRTRYRKESLVLFLLLVALCAITSQAQSGRRQPKPPPAAPVPTPTPEPTPQPKTTQDKEPELGFIIGADSFNVDAFPIAYYDTVAHACADRLRSGSSARVDVTQSAMNRGEAIKKAKAETKTYVVYMRLLLDEMTARSLDDLEVEYVVFAPQTGKVMTSGKAYSGGVRKGPIVVGPNSRTPGGPMYREQLLRRAGEEVGERILKAMHLDVPIVR